MKSYDLYKQWQLMGEAQRDYAVGYFLGGVGMHFEGFTRGHPDQSHAKYSLAEFEEALDKASRSTEGHDDNTKG